MTLIRVVRSVLAMSLIVATASFAGERVQSFAAKKGGRLAVRVDAGPITVRGWDKNEVFVRVTSDDEDLLKKVTITEGGGKVQVEYRGRGREEREIAFAISVPSSFDIDLRTAGGSLTVEGPLSGELEGSTAGGTIVLGNLGGKVKMETAGGSVTSGETTGDLFVRTAGGDITVKNVTGRAELSTAGGRIAVGTVARDLEASTAGGDLRIGNVGGNVKASTAGGTIRVQSGRGKVVLSSAGGGIELNSAQGGVSANTSAGNITLQDIQGSVSARSAAGDVTVMLDPAPGESSAIATSAGSIVLTLPSAAKASIMARNGGYFSMEGDDIHISSDFPITQKGSGDRGGRAEIEVNGGGHRISLETMIGSISVKKRK